MTARERERYAPWLLLVIVLVLWEAICRGFGISEFIFPSPSRIANQLVEFRGVIAGHAWRTFWVTMVGFGLSIVVGTLLGFVIGSSRMAYAAMYPLMTGFNAIPKAAFVPILVVWFGIGVGPAVLTAFLISFFPITGQHRDRPRDDRARARGRAARARRKALGRADQDRACRARCRTSTRR
jgi:NitT/TauT family transport system permease protein